MSRKIYVKIQETINYGREYDEQELQELLADTMIDLADYDDDELADILVGNAVIEEDMQRYSDVADTSWVIVIDNDDPHDDDGNRVTPEIDPATEEHRAMLLSGPPLPRHDPAL